MPASRLIKVDLPLPDLPMIATNSPRCTSTSMPLMTVKSPAGVLKALTRFLTSINGWLSLLDGSFEGLIMMTSYPTLEGEGAPRPAIVRWLAPHRHVLRPEGLVGGLQQALYQPAQLHLIAGAGTEGSQHLDRVIFAAIE